MHDDLSKEMNTHYTEIKLTKRKKIFAVLVPSNAENNPEILPLGCQKIIVTDCPQRKEDIAISKDINWKDIEVEFIYRLQLDSIWVGILCRIGTDIDDMLSHLVEYEHF